MSAALEMEIVPVERMVTPDTRQKLRTLEEILSKAALGFVEEGTALDLIREGKLYLAHHRYATYEEYIRGYWDECPSRAYQKINSAKSYNHLHNCGEKRLPDNEAQCRELSRLTLDLQLEAWRKVVKRVGSGTITAKIVRDMVSPMVEAIEEQKLKLENKSSPADALTPKTEQSESSDTSSQLEAPSTPNDASSTEYQGAGVSEGVTSIDEKFLEAWRPFWSAMEALMAAVGEDVVEKLIVDALPDDYFEDDEPDTSSESSVVRKVTLIESKRVGQVAATGGAAR